MNYSVNIVSLEDEVKQREQEMMSDKNRQTGPGILSLEQLAAAVL